MKYPKTLYSREYLKHVTTDHDHEKAKLRAAATVTVQTPDDHKTKLEEGYRESPADFDPDEDVTPRGKKLRGPVSSD